MAQRRSRARCNEKTNDRRMSANQRCESWHPGGLRRDGLRETRSATNAGDDGVAVHGIFDEIARDENVAVDIRGNEPHPEQRKP